MVPIVVDSECALGIEGLVCSTNEAIELMQPDMPNVSDGPLVVSMMKEKTQCETEECVLKSPLFANIAPAHVIKQNLERFKPKGPANSTNLLNNVNIDDVLHRLTLTFSRFYHMNFQMIDFATEPATELGKLDITTLIGKYDTFGVVLNTDVRTGGGIHWFSLFCDFRKSPFTVEYFNSSGNKPMIQVQEWIIKTVNALQRAGHQTKPVVLSGLVHQTASETECGLYSLYYIWNRLKHTPAQLFQQKPVHDSQMIMFRKMCFKCENQEA